MLFSNDKKDHRDPSHETLPLLPLRELIAFPHEIYPILVGRQKSIKALEAAEAANKPILLVAQKDARVSEPGPDDLHAVGTLAKLVQLLKLSDGTVKALLEGRKRARVVRYVRQDEFIQAEVEELEEFCDHTTEVEDLVRAVSTTFVNYARTTEKISAEAAMSIASVD